MAEFERSLDVVKELDDSNLSPRARGAVREALAGRAMTKANIALLRQRDFRCLPKVGRATLQAIVDWAAQHGVEIQR